MENEKIKTETSSENNVNQHNGNSEVKSRNKKVTIVLLALIIMLLIAIGVCVGLWFAGHNTKIINNKEEVVKEEENSKTEENKATKKIDETKPWVYDANYSKGKSVKILKNNTGKEYNSVDGLILPFINVNSEYGNSINEELKKMYENSYNNFGGASEEYKITSGFFPAYKYEYGISDNILSVVVYEYFGVINGGLTSKYHIYNINLNTLEEATLEDVYKECSFENETELNEKVKITIANEADKGNLFSDTVWDKKMYYMDKNINFNIVVDGPVTRCNVVIRKGVTREESADSSQNSTNEVNQNNTNVSSVNKIFNTTLKDIEEVSIAIIDENNTSAKVDIDKDGVEETIKFEKIDNDYWGDSFKLYTNNEVFYENNTNGTNGFFVFLRKLYVVDLDTSDNYYDIVIYGNHGSGGDDSYVIFKHNGITFKPIMSDNDRTEEINLAGYSLYVDNKGILVPQDGIYSHTNPVLSDKYYSYRENKLYDVAVSNYTSELIEFKDVFFTTDRANIGIYLESASKGESNEKDLLTKAGISSNKNIKVYIVEYEKNNPYIIKVRLEDGTLGYIFTSELWAG